MYEMADCVKFAEAMMSVRLIYFSFIFFFFNDTATTEIYTLSLHDALPIWAPARAPSSRLTAAAGPLGMSIGTVSGNTRRGQDRKSTRLNSSHANISYA